MKDRSPVPNLTWEEDVSGLQELVDSLRVMQNNHIEYGILHNEKYPSGDERAGQYVAQIAAEHETGTGVNNMPPRPFFIQSVHRLGKAKAKSIAEHLFKSAFTRVVDETDLKINADALADTIREEIDLQDFWALSPVTVSKKKGNTTILRDTDTMYDSFKGEVVKGRLPNENT